MKATSEATLNRRAGVPPTWLLGAGFAPSGMFNAFLMITIPQLLSADHVSEPMIAGITAAGLSPSFFSFVAAPLLDWRLSRRTYALLLLLALVLSIVATLVLINDLAAATAALIAGEFACTLLTAAVGAWFRELAPPEESGSLGAWLSIGNLAGGGLMAPAAIELIRGLPGLPGIVCAGLVPLLPGALYLWTRCSPPSSDLARERLREFARDILSVVRDRRLQVMLAIFLAPVGSFALTNIVGGLGADFSSSERLVSLLAGTGSVVASLIGGLAVQRLSRAIRPLSIYVVTGLIGAAFSLLLAALRRTPVTFGIAVVGENIFQAAAFAAVYGAILASIPRDSATAATRFGLLNAATMVPLCYMQLMDGSAYGFAGAAGTFAADALVTGASALILGGVLLVSGVRNLLDADEGKADAASMS